jgi:hypothetical protein
VVRNPADITVTCSNLVSPSVTGTATATDNCSTPVITYSDVWYTSNTLFRFWRATDAAGNISDMITAQVINIVDNIKPVITCPGNTSVPCGASPLPSVTGTATATDNCSTPTVTYSDVTSGNIITRTWTATDAAGNTSTCVQTITIVNAVPVTITTTPSATTYTGGVPTSLYIGYGPQTATLQVSENAAGAPYTYVWSGTNTNLLSSVNTNNPIFTATKAGSFTYTVTSTNKYGCSTTATVTLCVTDVRVVNVNGIYTDDDDDNQVMCDHTAHTAANCPHIGHNHTCNHQAHTLANCPHKIIVAVDNTQKDCDHTAHSAANCPHKGHNHACNHLAHTAATCPHDKANGQDQKVCNHLAHSAADCTHSGHNHAACNHQAHDPQYCFHNGSKCQQTGGTDQVLVFLCHYVSASQRTTLSLSIADVAKYLATYPNDKLGSCGQAPCSGYLDTVKPVITLPANVTSACSGQTSPSVTGTATAKDNMSATVAVSYSDVTNGNVIYRTWTATDQAGNVATAVQTITIIDNVAPTPVTKNISVYLDATGKASVTPSQIDNGSYDNCSAVTVSFKCASTTSGSNMCSNGDFSSSSACTSSWTPLNNDNSAGWRSTGGNPGGYFLLNSNGAVATDPTIQQTLRGLVPGQWYTISGQRNNIENGAFGNPSALSFGIAIDNTVLLEQANTGGANWIPFSVQFKATATTHVLSISAERNGDDTQYGIDNVSVVASSAPCNTGVITFDCSKLGANTVTLNVTDASGNTSSQNAVVTVLDNIAPVITDVPDITINCGGSTSPSTTGTPTASDNCSTPTLTYSDVTNGNVIIRTWKATDASGNYATSVQNITLGSAFTVSVTSVPCSGTYTGGICTNLYLGYGAQSTTLQPCSLPSAGAPYTYSWSGSCLNNTTCAAPVCSPTTAGYYNCLLTVTNKYGCKSVCSINICVTDVRVPGTNGSKVYVCHTPTYSWGCGTPQTLQLALNQVTTHLGSTTCGGGGKDRLGTADQSPCNTATVNTVVGNTSDITKEGSDVATTEEDLKVTVMPNPSTTFFTLKLESKFETPVNMRVMDAQGRVVDAKSKIGANSTIQIGSSYSSGTYYAEMIQGTRRKVVQLIKGRG